jgi:hypothetical protein
MRTLTLRELNRATLARQLLLRRARLSVPQAVERIAGIQAQDVPAAPLGLATRLERFDLDRALARGQVVKATLMRGTLHIVSVRDRELFLAALAPELRKFGRRFSAEDADGLLARAHAYAAEPRTAVEMRELLGSEEAWMRVRVEGHFVYVPPFGVARTVQTLLVDLQPEETGVGHMLVRYLRAFGPATAADAAGWSGLTMSAVRGGLARLRLRRFRDEQRRELVDLPAAPLPRAETPAPPRLLPIWDNVLVAFDDRARILPEAYREAIGKPSFLVDGVVAGVWSAAGLEPFEKLPRRTLDDLERERERLLG